jgi:hypothetical protein
MGLPIYKINMNNFREITNTGNKRIGGVKKIAG